MKQLRSIPSLDGLRAISITLVVAGHLRPTLPASVRDSIWLRMVSNPDLGVGAFLVISGFLITHLLLKEQSKAGEINLKRFYIRRAFRIFPPYYVYLIAVAAIWGVSVTHQNAINLLSSATYTSNYYPYQLSHPESTGWFLGHTWSLSLEEQFYLLWPFCLGAAGSKRAVKICFGVIAVVPFLRLLTYFCQPSYRLDGQFTRMLHTRLDALAFGCILALLYENKEFNAWAVKLLRPTLMVGVAVFVLLLSRRIEIPYLPGAYGLLFRITAESAGVALLILYLVRNPRSWAGRVLNSWPLRHLGVISYSVYLWQQMFSGKSPLVRFPFNIVLILIFAELSFWIVEQPSLRLRDLFESRRRARLPASTANVG